MKTFKTLLWVFIFIAAAYYLNGYMQKSQAGRAAGAHGGGRRAAQAISVKAIIAGTETVENVIEVNGRLYSQVESVISAETEGILENTFKEMGDFVSEGEMLAEIDETEYAARKIQAESDYLQALTRLSLDTVPVDISSINIENISMIKKAKANYENLRSSLWRVTELGKSQLASKQLQDDTASKLKAAEADLQSAYEEAKNLVLTLKSRKSAAELAAKKLADNNIVAPYNGFILKRMASKGEYVKVGTPLYSIVKSNPIKFSGAVAEAHMANIHAGKSIVVSVEALGATREVKIARVSPSANAENHSVEIEADLPNPENILKPGYFANAQIILYKKTDAVVVTNEALYTFAGINKVFVIKDSRSYERRIKIGRRFADRFEVAEGLAAGESVAVSNINRLYDGAEITLNGQNKSAAAQGAGREGGADGRSRKAGE